MIGWFSILAYLGAFFIETYGFDTQQAGLIFLAVGVGILAGSLATGGRLGARPLRPLLIGCRLIIIPLVGLTVLLPMPAIAAAALLVTLGFLFAVCNVSTVSLLAAETRAGRATTMAVFSTASNVGLGVGSALGGLLLSFSGYPMLGLEAMALCGASVGVLWWLRPMSVSEDSKV
jgi:predicted MFS family arabinose efflux permease